MSKSTPKFFQPVSRKRAAYNSGENRNSAGARELVDLVRASAGSRHKTQMSRDRARQSPVPNSSPRTPTPSKTARSS